MEVSFDLGVIFAIFCKNYDKIWREISHAIKEKRRNEMYPMKFLWIK